MYSCALPIVDLIGKIGGGAPVATGDLCSLCEQKIDERLVGATEAEHGYAFVL